MAIGHEGLCPTCSWSSTLAGPIKRCADGAACDTLGVDRDRWHRNMPDETLRRSLKSLHAHLERSDRVDPELAGLLDVLDRDIHRLLETETEQRTRPHGVIERAEAMAARYGADHPQLEGVFREIIDTLARIGV